MSSEIASSIPREEERVPAALRPWRTLVLQALGPLSMFGGILWAIAQPYRIVVLDREGQGIWDYAFQPPLLVVVVGAAFALLVAPGLVEDVEAEERDGA